MKILDNIIFPGFDFIKINLCIYFINVSLMANVLALNNLNFKD